MESDNSSNSDDSQSPYSSRSDNIHEEEFGSGSSSAFSNNSISQSSDNNTPGSQSLDSGIQCPELDNDDDDDHHQSPDSSSSNSITPFLEFWSPEQQQDNEPHSPEQHQNDEPQSPEQQQDDEPQILSSASSSSSHVSSAACSPDRNSHSQQSSKSNESDNYLADISEEDSIDNMNNENASQEKSILITDSDQTSSPLLTYNRWSVSPTNPSPSMQPVQRAKHTKYPDTIYTSSSSSKSVSGPKSIESSASTGTKLSSFEGSSKPKNQALSTNKLEAQINSPVQKENSVAQGKKRPFESDNDDP